MLISTDLGAYGLIDVLINNGGFMQQSLLIDSCFEEYNNMISIKEALSGIAADSAYETVIKGSGY